MRLHLIAMQPRSCSPEVAEHISRDGCSRSETDGLLLLVNGKHLCYCSLDPADTSTCLHADRVQRLTSDHAGVPVQVVVTHAGGQAQAPLAEQQVSGSAGVAAAAVRRPPAQLLSLGAAKVIMPCASSSLPRRLTVLAASSAAIVQGVLTAASHTRFDACTEPVHASLDPVQAGR